MVSSMMKKTLARAAAACTLGALLAAPSLAQNTYIDTVLAANNESYRPLNLVDPLLGNGWGIAIRPPGAGGHFWISNGSTGTTTTYVGDVHTPKGFIPLHQDELKSVDIPIGSGKLFDGRPVTPISIPTGQVFNHSPTDFVVSGEGITAASKFIFVQGDGTISGWTEKRDENNVLRRQTRSVIQVDISHLYDDERLLYTGCAVTDFPKDNFLFVTNWTGERVEKYDHNWQRVPIPEGRFSLPKEGETWRAWNIQYFHTGPKGEGRLWVTFNRAEDPWEEYPEFGAVAEFDLEGNMTRRFTQTMDTDHYADSELRDPWGLAIAPANFGPFSNMMLVANFGDGTIAAFDLKANKFVDFLRDAKGEPIIVDGIWGLTFGNGVALGDTNALYYAAGPNVETDGTFGTIRFLPDTCPVIASRSDSVSVCTTGGKAKFSVNAAGPTHQTYQWQVESAPGTWTSIADGEMPGVGVASGTTTPTLTIMSITRGSAFRCVVSNPCGSATSQPTHLVFDGAACCPGDANRDRLINAADVLGMLGAMGSKVPAGSGSDFNTDGVIDQQDLEALLNHFGTVCGM